MATPPSFVHIPPDGPRLVDLTDAGSGSRWSVEVRPFALATTVVTRRLWHQVRSGGDPGGHADLPAVEVSWREAVLFCNALSHAHGLAPPYRIAEIEPAPQRGWSPHDRPAPEHWQVDWDRGATGFRLPTEAEWQLACRADTVGPHYGPLADIAWYRGNSADRLHPVGVKTPNAWGLHDMLGGVWEWCWDLYDPATYGAYRVIRGGGWADPAWSCRAGVRRKTQPTARLDDIGVRLARNAG